MKLRSKGLGRKELVMDFREYDVSFEDGEVHVTGTIREPVTWDFSIQICGDDIPGMLKIGLNRHTIRLAARWGFDLARARIRGDRPQGGVAGAPVDATAPATPPRRAPRVRTSGPAATPATRPPATRTPTAPARPAASTQQAEPAPATPSPEAGEAPPTAEPAVTPEPPKVPVGSSPRSRTRSSTPPPARTPAPPPRQRTRRTVAADAMPGARGFPRPAPGTTPTERGD